MKTTMTTVHKGRYRLPNDADVDDENNDESDDDDDDDDDDDVHDASADDEISQNLH